MLTEKVTWAILDRIAPYTKNGDDFIAEYCPFCKGGDHRDKNTFAVNFKKYGFQCFRGKCGAKGTIKDLADRFNIEIETTGERDFDRSKRKIKFVKPKVVEEIKEPEKSEVVKYLKLRGISEETIKAYKIGEDDDGKTIVFRYYDEKEQHVFNKYRPARKVMKGERKAWRDKDTKSILYGVWKIPPEEEQLIITEGEIDALSIAEAGFQNVVSVPSGANDFDFIEHNWEFLQRFRQIIIWGDNDEPGREMVDRLVRKLKEGRCFIVETEYKDANLMLYKEGVTKVVNAIAHASPVEIDGIINLADVKHVDIAQVDRIPSIMKHLNKYMGGWMMGDITVLTGINGSGKSTFLGNELLYSITRGEKVFAYSGELPKERFRRWIDLMVAGDKRIKWKWDDLLQRDFAYLEPETVEKVTRFYDNKFYLFDTFRVARDVDLLRLFEYAYQRYNIRQFSIDNLMTTFFTNNGDDYFEKQSIFINEVKAFAMRYPVHIFVVAHPRKADGKLDKMDIKGSGDLTNVPDNVISTHRPTEKEMKRNKAYMDCDALLQIFKSREQGEQDIEIYLNFEKHSKMIKEIQVMEYYDFLKGE